MSKTITELQEIFDKCKDLVKEGDITYSETWRLMTFDELMISIKHNIAKIPVATKGKAIKDALDAINYLAFWIVKKQRE